MLTEKEERRLEYLRELREDTTRPFFPQQMASLRRLVKKQAHNLCANPRCVGYRGTDEETVCTKCGSELYKYSENPEQVVPMVVWLGYF